MNEVDTTSGIARSCMLVELRVSVYTGRRRDVATAKEVNDAKNAASARATSVNKNLFADCQELEAITKHVSAARLLHYEHTLPWNDSGARLLPVVNLLRYKEEMRKMEEEYEVLVRRFVDRYDILVATMGFKLGSLFDRNDYPSALAIARKFRWGVEYMPVPMSGDFRLDVESTVQKELAASLNDSLTRRVSDCMNDVYSRLYKMLSHLSERLEPDDGTTRRFRTTMIESALDTLDSLKYLNPLNDGKLENVRDQLVATLRGTNVESLRDREDHRAEIKSKVDTLLEQLDWSLDDDET